MSPNFPCKSPFIVQFLFIPSSGEVSLRRQFQKTPVKCRSLRLNAGAQITHGGQVQGQVQGHAKKNVGIPVSHTVECA